MKALLSPLNLTGQKARIRNVTLTRPAKRTKVTMGADPSLDSQGEDASTVPKKTLADTHQLSVDIRQALASKPLPDPAEAADPTTFLQDLVESMYGYRPHVRSSSKLSKYFPEITDEQIAAYDMEVINAARDDDLNRLKGLFEAGATMDCCNRFGESLLHLVCRRGFKEIVEFLLEDAQLSVRISDDCGRNPFHDVCWNPRAQIEIAKLLLERDPTLLLIGDKRGHTPFAYARPEDWKTWREFLFENRLNLEPFRRDSTHEIFGLSGE